MNWLNPQSALRPAARVIIEEKTGGGTTAATGPTSSTGRLHPIEFALESGLSYGESPRDRRWTLSVP